MACRCRQHKSNGLDQSLEIKQIDYQTLPDEQCDMCAEKHFSTAKRLMQQFGYVAINRQNIIGQLSAATWHIYKQNISIALKLRDLRHKIQKREQPKLEQWNQICNDFENILTFRIQQNLCSDKIFEQFKENVWVISNCQQLKDNIIKPNQKDLLIFLNKATSLQLYKNHLYKAVFHRSPDENYGTNEDKSVQHYYCFKGKDQNALTIPKKVIEQIKIKYDWNYQVQEGKQKCATTGYMVVKYLQQTFPNANIKLVNFGFGVKQSSYRCPYHNWQFQNQDLRNFQHIYTDNQMIKSIDGKKRVLYKMNGWLGDNIYGTAVVENIMNTGQFLLNIDTNHPEVWKNCSYLDKTITKQNADLIIRQRNINDWRIGTPHIIEGVTKAFSYDTSTEIPCVTKKPICYIDLPKERKIQQKYVLFNNGWQNSAKTKRWSNTYWKQLISRCKDIKFVQIGQTKNHSKYIEGAVNLIDKTNESQLYQLIRDAECVISPPSGVIHIAGMFDTPYISLCGGRQPSTLVEYKNGIGLCVCGELDCCKQKGCHLNQFEGTSICKYFQKLQTDTQYISKCMLMITPQQVENNLRILMKYKEV